MSQQITGTMELKHAKFQQHLVFPLLSPCRRPECLPCPSPSRPRYFSNFYDIVGPFFGI